MRAALFGGTFDPIHRGHLAIASAAAEAFALDQVLFAPTGRQPLKPELPAAPFADRLAMVALALESTANPRFTASTFDAPHPDGSPNYTVDLLETLRRKLPTASLFVLAGADSFLDLPHWRDPQTLLALAEWIVVTRPGSQLSLDHPALVPLELTPAQRARIHLLENVHEDVSATELRVRLRAGDPCTGLLSPAVAAYIQTHHLYR
jgi:nicotinate-nucleotide adenylyltransferase